MAMHCRETRIAFREEKFLRALISWGREDMSSEVGASAVALIHHDRHPLLMGQMLRVGTFSSQRFQLNSREEACRK